MLNAMADWEAVVNVDFQTRNGQANYVRVRDWTGNNSAIGPQGGEQIINITSWTQEFRIAHELGHCLGYWHEQSRLDRGSYVVINYGNIQGVWFIHFKLLRTV
jgi:hypothetical protein